MPVSTLFKTAFCALLALAAAPSSAEDYPSRPITIVVPFGAGSGSDIAARFLARSLKEKLNATVVVDLKPGAAGMIAGQIVARAPADGYTLLMGSGTVNAANHALFRDQIGYGPQHFAVVATLYLSPPLLLAHKDLPGDSVSELIAQAQRSQRKLSCGSGNAVTQVACELLRRKTGADIVSVTYKGNGQSMIDLASGQIAIGFSDMAAAGPHVTRGAIRMIGVPGPRRLPTLPQVPTLAEQGISDFEFMSWNTLYVPAGTPAEITQKLNEVARHMLASPEWEKQRLSMSGLKVSGDMKESQAFVQDEVLRWERYVRETGVKGSL